MKNVIKLFTKEITISDAFQEFLADRQRNNVTEATILDYQVIFKIFLNFCNNNDMPCANIDLELFDSYKDFLLKTKKNVVTVNTYLRHARAVINFFIEKNYTNSFKMKLVKQDKTKKEVYTEEEIEKLLVRPDTKKCGFAEYRNWVIINYILGTGNRLNTIRNILIKDISFQERKIFLRVTKGREQYYIPLESSLSKILTEYLNFRKGRPEDFLFCTETGTQLTKTGLQTAIRRYNLKRGVDKTSEHLLRHTFSKLYYVYGGDLASLNYLLGHKSIEMTKHYLNLLCDDVQSRGASNPLEQLTKRKERITIK